LKLIYVIALLLQRLLKNCTSKNTIKRWYKKIKSGLDCHKSLIINLYMNLRKKSILILEMVILVDDVIYTLMGNSKRFITMTLLHYILMWVLNANILLVILKRLMGVILILKNSLVLYVVKLRLMIKFYLFMGVR